jgi:hypothetical protein
MVRRFSIVPVALAAALAGCGEAAPPPRDQAPVRTAAKPASSSPKILVFRRIRYEGATTRTLILREDGTFDVNIPNGGAGGSQFEGELTPAMLRTVRRDIARTPWDHLSRRKAAYDASGAYFMVRHAGREHVAMSAGMSRDLMPLVTHANSVLNGKGRARYENKHRFYFP